METGACEYAKQSKIIRAKGERCPISYRHERSGRAVCQAIATELSKGFEPSKQNLHDHIPAAFMTRPMTRFCLTKEEELVDVPSASGGPICTHVRKLSFQTSVIASFAVLVGLLHNFRVWRRAVPQAKSSASHCQDQMNLRRSHTVRYSGRGFPTILKMPCQIKKLKAQTLHCNIDINKRDHEGLKILVESSIMFVWIVPLRVRRRCSTLCRPLPLACRNTNMGRHESRSC